MRLTSQWPRAFHALLEGSVYCCTSQGALHQSRLAQSGSTLAALSSSGQHARSLSSCAAQDRSGFRTLLVVQGAALLWYVGPRQTVPITCKALVACSLARGLHVLATNSSQEVTDKKDSSIWDWTPPGDLAETGTWKVLRELAGTLSKSKEHLPALRRLEVLPTHEIALRLFYLYDHYRRNPVASGFPDAEAQGMLVKPELVQKLAFYLWFAEYSYEAGTEPNLKKVLTQRGFELNFAKMNATWGEHEPAYYVATHTKSKEMLVVVRGTWTMEDVVTDITALPVAFDGGEHLAHSGMNASAVYLFHRIYSLAQALKDDYRMTLIGHSLGAGAAALLAMMLQARGITNVHCYAFAPPMCCEPDLAAKCSDYVTSVVFRDDIIARVSQESVVSLYEELVEYDWKAASKDENTHPELRKYTGVLQTIAGGAGGRIGSWLGLTAFSSQPKSQPLPPPKEAEKKSEGSPSGHGSQIEAAQASPPEDKGYNPLVPGKVVYVHRTTGKDEYDEKKDGLARVLTDGSCPDLRKIHLSGFMLTDHLTDSYFSALDSVNPTKQGKDAQKSK